MRNPGEAAVSLVRWQKDFSTSDWTQYIDNLEAENRNISIALFFVVPPP